MGRWLAGKGDVNTVYQQVGASLPYYRLEVSEADYYYVAVENLDNRRVVSGEVYEEIAYTTFDFSPARSQCGFEEPARNDSDTFFTFTHHSNNNHNHNNELANNKHEHTNEFPNYTNEHEPTERKHEPPTSNTNHASSNSEGKSTTKRKSTHTINKHSLKTTTDSKVSQDNGVCTYKLDLHSADQVVVSAGLSTRPDTIFEVRVEYSGRSGFYWGVLLGAVVGGVLLLAVVGGTLLWVVRQRRRDTYASI
jgi:hypothetical protein